MVSIFSRPQCVKPSDIGMTQSIVPEAESQEVDNEYSN